MKAAFVRLAPFFIIEILKTGFKGLELVDGFLPQDVKFRSVHFDDLYQSFNILIESESFDEVPIGNQIPFLGNLTFKKL